VSDAVGTRNAWDEAGGVPQKPLMSAGHMREWAGAGMEIGAHSRSHADLTVVDQDTATAEIVGSKRALEECLQTEVRHFCYPYGRHTARHREMVRAAGYLSATTVQRGRVRSQDDRFALPRVLVSQSTHLALFWLKLTTAYEDRRR
jgi:peptidoglycan/xylan/chitin deacetylase (PgdA/CDA1 family)